MGVAVPFRRPRPERMLLTLVVSHPAIAEQNGNQLPHRQCFDATAKPTI